MRGYREVNANGFGPVSSGGVFGFSLVWGEFSGGFVGLEGFKHLVHEAFNVL